MLQICCKNNNISKNFPIGSSLLDIYNGFNLDIPYGPVSAKVNNKVEGLNYRAYNNKDVEFLNILNPSGMRTYVRSLCFILCKAVEDLYPDGKIMLEHPVSKGYYCALQIGRETELCPSFLSGGIVLLLQLCDIQNGGKGCWLPQSLSFAA